MPSKCNVEICESRCKGCEFCVAVCNRGVLRMDGATPVVEAPDRCTGCELCVWICPDFAIKITKEVNYSGSLAES